MLKQYTTSEAVKMVEKDRTLRFEHWVPATRYTPVRHIVLSAGKDEEGSWLHCRDVGNGQTMSISLDVMWTKVESTKPKREPNSAVKADDTSKPKAKTKPKTKTKPKAKAKPKDKPEPNKNSGFFKWR